MSQKLNSSNDGLTELSLWYSPNGLNYSNNFELGYDVCYFWLSTLDLNTFFRGQNDTGDCLSTLDQTCVNDMLSLTDLYSRQLVSAPSPGPDSNLTTNSLPTVCQDMAQRLTQNFPDSCKVYMNQSLPFSVFGGPPALGGGMYCILSKVLA